MEKIFAAGITKTILTPSMFKEGLPIKSPTASTKMDIILRKESLETFKQNKSAFFIVIKPT